MANYRDLYTHSYPMKFPGEAVHFMEHSDGAVSVGVYWSGIDYEATGSNGELAGLQANYKRMLVDASVYHDLYIESHFLRYHDPDILDVYYQYGVDNVKQDRNPELALRIRKAIADEFAKYSRSNFVFLIFTIKPNTGFFSKNKSVLVKDRKVRLQNIVQELTSNIDDQNGSVRLLGIEEYNYFIHLSNDCYLYKNNKMKMPFNYRFKANSFIRKPVLHESGCLMTSGGSGGLNSNGDSFYGGYHKVVVLLDYPMVSPDWFSCLSTDGSDHLHVVQVINPLDSQVVTRKSAVESERSSEAANVLGGEEVAGKVADHADFRQFVQANNLTVHDNVFIVVISGNTPEAVKSYHQKVTKRLRDSSDDVKYMTNDPVLELLYYRVATPGMGYKSPFMRADHHAQLGFMAPCFIQSHGAIDKPEEAFLTSSSTVVFVEHQNNGVHHGLNAAKTGSGKTVTMASRVAQLYPLGKDFYVTELGRSFEWLFKAFGGDYKVLDADVSVVSPFASYSEIDLVTEGLEKQIPATVITTIRNCILPILLSSDDPENEDGIEHFNSLTDEIIGFLYTENSFRDPGLDSPSLETFLNCGRICLDVMNEDDSDDGYDGDYRAEHLERMLNSLESFLNSSEGKVFKKPSNIDFSNALIGLDFDSLIKGGATKLASYMLLFTATRLQQMAFTRPNQAFLTFDEDHEYTNINPRLMNNLKRQVTKRGRKSAAYLFPISQAVEDIAFLPDGTVNKDVINQMSTFFLLYYGTDTGNLSEAFKLSERATNIWNNYPDPLANKLDYRQGLFVQNGKAIDCHIVWPKILNDITNTNPDAMALKLSLDEKYGDDFVSALNEFSETYQ